MHREDLQQIDGLDRRRFLLRTGSGLGAMGLTSLLLGDGLLAMPSETQGLTSRSGLHHAPKAQRVIEIFCPED